MVYSYQLYKYLKSKIIYSNRKQKKQRKYLQKTKKKLIKIHLTEMPRIYTYFHQLELKLIKAMSVKKALFIKKKNFVKKK